MYIVEAILSTNFPQKHFFGPSYKESYLIMCTGDLYGKAKSKW